MSLRVKKQDGCYFAMALALPDDKECLENREMRFVKVEAGAPGAVSNNSFSQDEFHKNGHDFL